MDLVTSNARIDIGGPRIDAAIHRRYVGKALRRQPRCRFEAAHAMVTISNDETIFGVRQRLAGLRKAAERRPHRLRDVALRKLPVFAHIDQQRRVALRHGLGDVFGTEALNGGRRQRLSGRGRMRHEGLHSRVRRGDSPRARP